MGWSPVVGERACRATCERRLCRTPSAEVSSAPIEETRGGLPATFVYASAAIAGFAFLLMELVWYRMLGPLLGGTVFTFGLILSFALK